MEKGVGGPLHYSEGRFPALYQIMDALELDRTLGDLASTLGDPTRRGIYIAIRQAAEPMTASQVAELFDIHPNVARHHLDRLAQDGYLRVARGKPTGSIGAGRPAKRYEATDKEIDLHFPARRYDLLVELMVQVLERLAPDQAAGIAEEVGRDYGRRLAAEIGLPDHPGFPAAVKAVAKVMSGMGFGSRAEPDAGQILTSHCPFGQAAIDHPAVVCSLDRGIRQGLIEAVDPSLHPVTTPHHPPEEACVTEMRAEL